MFLHGPSRQRRVSEPRNLLHGNNKSSGSSSLFTLHAWRAEREIGATVGKRSQRLAFGCRPRSWKSYSMILACLRVWPLVQDVRRF
ncbi:hypothetical protein CEXT_441981 [Caerostris extrusa]|uniref:Uncharacterized protein n=1 Tax=Caerostris extrusa TaxID=172846 RepID=A0AAV4QGW6_CAEEX|nr:hypothetical protein CEXT_441981 [Caerostris extrusa]